MNTSFNGGAHVEDSGSYPSVDLAQLIEILIKAIGYEKQARSSGLPHNLEERPLIYFDSDADPKRLKICTPGILRRLCKREDFRNAFGKKSKGGPGFIRDFEALRYGTSAILGGRLTAGNEKVLKKLLGQLLQEIDRQAPNDKDLSLLLLDDAESQLQKLARNIGSKLSTGIETTSIQPLVFEQQDRVSQEGKIVAKVISALEQIETRDYFDKMKTAVSKHLEYEEQDEDVIEEAIKNLEAEKESFDSQINKLSSI